MVVVLQLPEGGRGPRLSALCITQNYHSFITSTQMISKTYPEKKIYIYIQKDKKKMVSPHPSLIVQFTNRGFNYYCLVPKVEEGTNGRQQGSCNRSLLKISDVFMRERERERERKREREKCGPEIVFQQSLLVKSNMPNSRKLTNTSYWAQTGPK